MDSDDPDALPTGSALAASAPVPVGGKIVSQPPPRLPPFLSKILSMLGSPVLGEFVAWSPAGDSVLIRQVDSFAASVLPKYFKHNNYSSFVRQLHIYGFRKEAEDGSGVHEFRNPLFVRGASAASLLALKRNAKAPEGHAAPSLAPAPGGGGTAASGVLLRAQAPSALLGLAAAAAAVSSSTTVATAALPAVPPVAWRQEGSGGVSEGSGLHAKPSGVSVALLPDSSAPAGTAGAAPGMEGTLLGPAAALGSVAGPGPPRADTTGASVTEQQSVLLSVDVLQDGSSTAVAPSLAAGAAAAATAGTASFAVWPSFGEGSMVGLQVLGSAGNGAWPAVLSGVAPGPSLMVRSARPAAAARKTSAAAAAAAASYSASAAAAAASAQLQQAHAMAPAPRLAGAKSARSSSRGGGGGGDAGDIMHELKAFNRRQREMVARVRAIEAHNEALAHDNARLFSEVVALQAQQAGIQAVLHTAVCEGVDAVSLLVKRSGRKK